MTRQTVIHYSKYDFQNPWPFVKDNVWYLALNSKGQRQTVKKKSMGGKIFY
jgi:hypothetical protein